MTTTQPAGLALDDPARLLETLDRVALTGLTDRITVQITGPASPEPCTECPDGLPGDVVVHWGYARPCYTDWVCHAHLKWFLGVHVRHDRARPVVDIPAAVIA